MGQTRYKATTIISNLALENENFAETVRKVGAPKPGEDEVRLRQIPRSLKTASRGAGHYMQAEQLPSSSCSTAVAHVGCEGSAARASRDYFHNFIYDGLWKERRRMNGNRYPRYFASNTHVQVIFVGDLKIPARRICRAVGVRICLEF